MEAGVPNPDLSIPSYREDDFETARSVARETYERDEKYSDYDARDSDEVLHISNSIITLFLMYLIICNII